MLPRVSNFFHGTTSPLPSDDEAALPEEFLTLLDTPQIKIERIISHAQASPPDFWYDQPEDEWVLVLRGEATLEFADGGMVDLPVGSHLLIPKHTRHRVERTTAETIWLAIFFKP